MHRGPGPRRRRAPLRLGREGPWALLVLAAATLLATAAAAAPLFLSSAGDAAMTDVLRTVPTHPPAADAASVHLNGGSDPTDALQSVLIARVAAIPGLTKPSLSAGSVGRELLPPDTLFSPYVAAGGPRVGARLFGQQDLAASIVPAAGSPTVAAAGPGVWLPTGRGTTARPSRRHGDDRCGAVRGHDPDAGPAGGGLPGRRGRSHPSGHGRVVPVVGPPGSPAGRSGPPQPGRVPRRR